MMSERFYFWQNDEQDNGMEEGPSTVTCVHFTVVPHCQTSPMTGLLIIMTFPNDR